MPAPDSKREVLPYARQSVDESDVEAVAEALRSDWLTTGPRVDAFEEALCAATGAAHAVVVNSGTAALHAAYFGVGVRPGDQLLTTPLTFFATASAALHLGMDVAFADVDADTGLLDPGATRDAVGDATRIVVPVDYAGQPADARAFEEIAAEREALRVVIDASHSLGASRDGRRVGEMGDASTLSFHPVKPITSGEGGAVLCRTEAMAAAARRFRNHGMRRADELERDAGTSDRAPVDGARSTGGVDRASGRSIEPWHYEIEELGLNYRLPDLNCALGLSQLKKLSRFIERRRAIAAQYQAAFASLPALATPVAAPGSQPGWHLYVLRVHQASRRRAFFEDLRARGLGVQVHYEPVHLQPFFAERGFRAGQFPAAESFASRAVSIPLFPAMTEGDVARVIEAVAGAHAATL